MREAPALDALDSDRKTGRQGPLRAFIARASAELLTRCTRCGECFKACPMTPWAEAARAADPVQVVEGILELLAGRPGSAEALSWASVCSHSGRCKVACPEGLDAKLMVRIARMAALGSLEGPAQIPEREDREFFRRINAFARLQLDEAEIERWHRPPSDAETHRS
jgi:L-lactate utilization protein LutB